MISDVLLDIQEIATLEKEGIETLCTFLSLFRFLIMILIPAVL